MKTEVHVPVKNWHPNRLIRLKSGEIVYTATKEWCGVVVYSPEGGGFAPVGHIFYTGFEMDKQPYSVLPSGTSITFNYED